MPVYRNITAKKVYITNTDYTLPGEFFYYPPAGSSRIDSLIDAKKIRLWVTERQQPSWMQLENAKLEQRPKTGVPLDVVDLINQYSAYLMEKLPQQLIVINTVNDKCACTFLHNISKKLWKRVLLPHLSAMGETCRHRLIYSRALGETPSKTHVKLYFMWDKQPVGTATRVPWEWPDVNIYSLPGADEYAKAIRIQEHERQVNLALKLEQKTREWREAANEDWTRRKIRR